MEIVDVNAATIKRIKNKPPMILPPGIASKTFGKTSNTNAGPAAGSLPGSKANKAGKTINPPRSATEVSIPAIHPEDWIILAFLGK